MHGPIWGPRWLSETNWIGYTIEDLTYLRSIAALFVLVGVGALYDVSSGAPLNSAEGVSPQHAGSVTFSESVITMTTSVETASPEEPQELPSVQEESVQEEQETQQTEPNRESQKHKKTTTTSVSPFTRSLLTLAQ